MLHVSQLKSIKQKVRAFCRLERLLEYGYRAVGLRCSGFFLLRNIAKKRNFFYTIYKGINIVLNHHQTTAWC